MQGFHSADQAQKAFYESFSRGDLTKMKDVWSDERDVVCVHPGSDVLHGKKQIMRSWERIMTPGMSASIDVEPVSAFESENLVVYVVYEHLGTGAAGQLATVIATNVYRRGDSGWQIVEHHGSQTLTRSGGNRNSSFQNRVLQ